ncbi:hypothetical protein BC826DRAFT_1107082 [Russula brevipes]|nr:hypothetical protein BC826DRAFT_1107082 [Russula brevipes]
MDSWRPWAIGAGAVVGTLLTPVVVPVSLGWIGFGAAGPLAGSLAAGWQASIGSVAAGSLFATAQSVAMGGAVPTIVSALGAGVGAAVAGIASAIADGAADGTSVCVAATGGVDVTATGIVGTGTPVVGGLRRIQAHN